MAKRCNSRNSAGRRCKYDRINHPEQDGRHIHMRGAATWNGPRYVAVNQLQEAARRAGFAYAVSGDPAPEPEVYVQFGVPRAAEELAGRSTSAAHELAEWWRATSEAEIGQTVEKAIEYGATDLIDIGLMLARTMGRVVSEEEAAELGVFFYLIGKIARWQSAIERGDRPSDDTLLDIGVYVRMAQRIRQSGGWPGTKEDVK